MWRSYPRSLLKNFYPRSPCGERRCWDCAHKAPAVFLSTLSLRRATCFSKTWGDNLRYFYPRSPCGERRFCIDGVFTATEISIHALLAESDLPALASILQLSLFLSTLSLRRATHRNASCLGRHQDFYPRSPCGERPGHQADGCRRVYFYPRSPCGERPIYLAMSGATFQFLSTLSLRRATHLQPRPSRAI